MKKDIIIKAVCDYFGYSVEEIKTDPSRKGEIALTRTIITYLLRKHTHMILAEIGLLLGGRKHSTMSHNLKRLSEWVEVNRLIREDLNHLETLVDHRMKTFNPINHD